MRFERSIGLRWGADRVGTGASPVRAEQRSAAPLGGAALALQEASI